VEKEIELLRSVPRALPIPAPSAPQRRSTLRIARKLTTLRRPVLEAIPLRFGELEIGVSKDGKNVVIAGNQAYAVAIRGAPFVHKPRPGPFRSKGDPSVAVAPSGTFYLAYIGLPNGEPDGQGVKGCSTAISKSIDNGDQFTFTFLSHAVLSPKTRNNPITDLFLPDQAHLAADPVNLGDGGADQLYSVYRHCPGYGTETDCEQTTRWCRGRPSIVCSKDGGATWGSHQPIENRGSNEGLPLLVENSGAADFPRVTAARDGFVYVVYRNGNQLKVHKYSSCASGLVEQVDFPIEIPMPNNFHRCMEAEQLIDKCHCPIAGLDRCNNGNLLSSPMVAADDIDPSRIYVAYALNTSVGKYGKPANDDIMVHASTDGGKTWPLHVIINDRIPARRFMPWVCSLGGRAFVTWYDRRAKTRKDNDLTDYYLGVATLDAGTLRAGAELNLSRNPDRQCDGRGSDWRSAWPEAPRKREDAESCSRQPQLAGRCSPGGAPCDFGSATCGGATCQTGEGKPKYGDYNGNACAAGKIFAAWASGTAPTGLAPSLKPPSDSIIRVYHATINAYGAP